MHIGVEHAWPQWQTNTCSVEHAWPQLQNQYMRVGKCDTFGKGCQRESFSKCLALHAVSQVEVTLRDWFALIFAEVV